MTSQAKDCKECGKTGKLVRNKLPPQVNANFHVECPCGRKTKPYADADDAMQEWNDMN